jgi:hypothetical protein
MSHETLQQSNMFTGEWEAKRTRNRLQQMPMFSINETFEFGARVRPWLAEAGTPTLELIREDVRTPEEIEGDLMREAEALTSPMFASEVMQESKATEPTADGLTEYPVTPVSQHPATRSVVLPEGLRARLRREHIPVRTRQPKPKSPEVAPTLWMEREYIQKRLPYLAEGISRLDEGELASLAESISEVLQETCWTILGITLAHYLDHEQRERIA